MKTECDLKHAELVGGVEEKVETCQDQILEELRRIRVDLERGFPKNKDGEPDFSGHAEYHAKLMRATEEQERFWRDLRLDLAKRGAWAMMSVIVGLLILGAATKLGIHLSLMK